MVPRVAAAEGDGRSYAAIALDVAGFGVVAIAFIPDLFQEVGTIMLIIAFGLIMFLSAVILAISAIKTKRQGSQRPWVASVALVLGLLPLALGLWLVGQSVYCMSGGDCGGTG
jgi:hypothetical protein